MTLLYKQSQKENMIYTVKSKAREKYLYKICDNSIRKNITGIRL